MSVNLQSRPAAATELREAMMALARQLRRHRSDNGLTLSQLEPLSVQHGISQPEHNKKGHIITLEFDTFHLINYYTPNAQRDLKHLTYHTEQ